MQVPLKEQVFNDNRDVADSMLEQALLEWKAPKGEVYLRVQVQVILNCLP